MFNKKIKIAINGFGRIGRAAFKIILQNHKNIEIVAINDLTDNKTLAHLLKYDTIYGKFSDDVLGSDEGIEIEGVLYKVFAEKDPWNLPWKKLGVDVVLECTGLFTKYEDAKKHIDAGAKKVIISAPSKSKEVEVFVLGVNDNKIKNQAVISNASCTTNCIAPVMKVLEENFGVEKALMTTIHSYTADQNLVDAPHRKGDLRRARAAVENMVPTTTGAAIAVAKTLPALDGKFDGLAVRVPTAIGSLSDITAVLKKDAVCEEINRAFKQASETNLKGILAVSNEPLVSSDIRGSHSSTIVDLPLTKVIGGNLAKIICWYDNEWAYSCRLVELAERIIK
ncbi:MAG: type I glyceraldehyde-3-phosphate dehydrogenase [bacterium]